MNRQSSASRPLLYQTKQAERQKYFYRGRRRRRAVKPHPNRAKRLECAVFPRFPATTHRQVLPPLHPKRRNTPHSKRFATSSALLGQARRTIFADRGQF